MNHHELSEEDWKQHFAARLAALFMSHGLNESAALADAWAHADIRYPARTKATPEGEAEAEHAALEVEAAWT